MRRDIAIARVAIAAWCLGLVLAADARASAPDGQVDYELSPQVRQGELVALSVSVRFRGDGDGETEFGWNPSWGGDTALWRWSRDLVVEGAESVEDLGQGRRRIRAAPGAPLTVRYRIVSAFDHDPTVSDDARQTYPIVRPGWFYSIGQAVFARPEGRDEAPATFAWTGAPAGFRFASNLEPLQARRGAKARVYEIRRSVLIGGRDLHVTEPLGRGSGFRIASVGKFQFSRADLDTTFRQVAAVQREFWGDRSNTPFLVTLAPLKGMAEAGSTGGTAMSGAFAMWVNDRLPLADVRWIVAHEYFHTWNPAALGGLTRGSEGRDYWFSEGLTDYYTRALLVRSGLISPEEFADLWNMALRSYAASPVRALSGDEAAAAFWSGPAGELPYIRGALLAVTWNGRLRAASGGRRGLDDVLLAQLQRVRKDRRGAVDLFLDAAPALGLDVTEDLARFIDRGEPIELASDAFGACATVATERLPTYSLGFDYAATSRGGMRVAGVQPGSAADAAGLRDGQQVRKAVIGSRKDPAAPVVLDVEEAGTVKTVRYLPQGPPVQTQQVRLKPGAGAACAASLGGLN